MEKATKNSHHTLMGTMNTLIKTLATGNETISNTKN